MQFQKRSEEWDHTFGCNHLIEKFTLTSQEGKGKTGEVKHSGDKLSFFREKLLLLLLSFIKYFTENLLLQGT